MRSIQSKAVCYNNFTIQNTSALEQEFTGLAGFDPKVFNDFQIYLGND